MADRYGEFSQSRLGREIVKRLGLPNPVPLRRYEAGAPPLTGSVAVGASSGGRLKDDVMRVVEALKERAGGRLELSHAVEPRPGFSLSAIVYDATGIASSADLRQLYDFFHPIIRQIGRNGRVVVLGTTPSLVGDRGEAIAQRSLEGFMRSLGKEIGRGATAQLVHVDPEAGTAIDSTMRFLLSPRSAFVSGQVIRVRPAEVVAGGDPDTPLSGRTALVTGAARGIGAAIAHVLARQGARVHCLDVPGQAEHLRAVAAEIGGEAVTADVTDVQATGELARTLAAGGGVDIVVHNAGITRDRTLGRMSTREWDAVLAVNLRAPETFTEALLAAGAIPDGGRIVCVSSIGGIAGNPGQTNYGATKAGIIGFVDAWAPELAPRGITVNAVAPGFIETPMTDAMPLLPREVGRRLSSLAQGGQPIDVAETIAWFAEPGSAGVNGAVVRVCGQALIGA